MLPNRQKRDHIEWMQTARFVEEVHLLEREGRVRSRDELERLLLLQYTAVAMMRAGKLRVSLAAIHLLKAEYNGDFQYVVMGVRDQQDKAGPWRAGRDLRRYAPYEYAYRSEAVDLARLSGLPMLEKGEAPPPEPEASA